MPSDVLIHLDVSLNEFSVVDAEGMYGWVSRAVGLSLTRCAGLDMDVLITAELHQSMSFIDLSRNVRMVVQALCTLHSLRIMVLDGTSLAPAHLVDVVSAVVRNPNLRDTCLCLRDLNISSKTWPTIARV